MFLGKNINNLRMFYFLWDTTWYYYISGSLFISGTIFMKLSFFHQNTQSRFLYNKGLLS